MQKKKRKWIIPVIIIGVIVVLIAIFLHYVQKKSEELLSAMTQMETAYVERRDLVSSISASGKVVGRDSETVKSVLSGITVAEIPVEVGDRVKEGDVLLVFDAHKLENTLVTAENTQEESSLTNGFNVLSAEEELRDAQDAYNRQIVTLQMNVDLKQRDFETAGNELEKARTDYLADETEEKAEAYNTAYTKSSTAYAAYQEALNNLETQKVSLLEAIEKAQYNLNLAQMKSGNDTSEASVSDAASDVEKTTVTAPISGTVTSVSVAEGDTYAGGAIMTIEDESDYEISAQIDEYDIAKVKKGQRVVIRTNATGEEEFSGTVLSVAPKATSVATSATATTSAIQSSSQDVTYEVRISLDQKNQALKLDMTAKVSIIIEEKDGALTVPYAAVQTDEDGRDYVEVVDKSESTESTESASPGGMDFSLPETRRVPVERGIESAYYIEIISDELPEGTEVIVPNESNGLSDLMEIMAERGPMGGF